MDDRTRTIVTVDRETTGTLREALQLGAVAYFVLPAETDALVEHVARLRQRGLEPEIAHLLDDEEELR